MSEKSAYLPLYASSHALVIGINKYENASPLLHAKADAEAVAKLLVERFGFPVSNVDVLLDGKATRGAIMSSFFRYAAPALVAEDDRILIFFAGHGHTVPGRRGETGFLVPVDGDVNNLATLIRWDDLTKSADLIPAKHMLFLMDACYGGLALTRQMIPPGSMRFLKDMLQRYSRQVLTAGKADEEVADSGGTRPGHSIFTSCLLDGLEGAAAAPGSVLTGHGLMAYVYEKVSNDVHSRQTPHFGFIDGDGDFIFDMSSLNALDRPQSLESEPEIDVFIQSPAFEGPPLALEEAPLEKLKRLISAPSERIRLDDFVTSQIRQALAKLDPSHFPTSGTQISSAEFAERLQRYEDAVGPLLTTVVLLARWAEADQVKLMEKVLSRIAEANKTRAGLVAWVNLAWYPLLMLMYAAGITALSAERVAGLRAALLTPVYSSATRTGSGTRPIVQPVVDELSHISDTFKLLPGMDRKYVPLSEHLLKKLQPILEDQLFLGRTYESFFDQFEILLALTYGDLRADDPPENVWGPLGRFGWKERGIFSDDRVYSAFVQSAKLHGESWSPLKEGFFRGSAKRFAQIADAYSKLLSRINLV